MQPCATHSAATHAGGLTFDPGRPEHRGMWRRWRDRRPCVGALGLRDRAAACSPRRDSGLDETPGIPAGLDPNLCSTHARTHRRARAPAPAKRIFSIQLWEAPGRGGGGFCF